MTASVTYDRLRGSDHYFFVLAPYNGDLVASRAETYESANGFMARVPDHYPHVLRSTHWGVATLETTTRDTLTLQARIVRERFDNGIAAIRDAIRTSDVEAVSRAERILVHFPEEKRDLMNQLAARVDGIVSTGYEIMTFPVRPKTAQPDTAVAALNS